MSLDIQQDAPARIEPACSVCGRRDATVRVVEIPIVISILVATFRRAFVGIWCRRHRSWKWLLASLVTSTIGWLGIPYGILMTPGVLFRLARGGVQDPEANHALQVAIAKDKQAKGDTRQAIRCFEESLRFRQNPEVREHLARLYATSLTDFDAWTSFLGQAFVVALLLTGASLLGFGVGIVQVLVSLLMNPLIGSSDSIFVVILSWVPPVITIFFGVAGLNSVVGWALKKMRCTQRALALTLAAAASVLMIYGVLQVNILSRSIFNLITVYSYSTREALLMLRGLLAYGGVLELTNAYRLFEVVGAIWLALYATGLVFGLFVSGVAATEVVTWQERLRSAHAPSGSMEEGSLHLPAWLAAAGWFSLLAAAILLLSGGRFVNFDMAAYHAVEAITRLNEGNTNGAMEDLDQASRYWPDAVMVHVNRAVAYAAQENYDEGLASLDQALRADPASLLGHFFMGYMRSGRGEYAQAVEEFKLAIELRPDWGVPHAALASLYYLLDQPELMEHELNAAIELEEDDRATSSALGEHYAGINEYEKAVDHLVRAIAIEPTSDDYLLLAHVYMLEEELESAEGAIKQAAQAGADDLHLSLAKADLATAREDWEGALAILQDALAISPENSEVHASLSYVHFHLGQIRAAAGEAERAIAIQPYSFIGYVELAYANQALGKAAEALEAAEWGAAHMPKYDRAHFILGQCYMDSDRNLEAIQEFEKFLSLYRDRPGMRPYKTLAEATLERLKEK